MHHLVFPSGQPRVDTHRHAQAPNSDRALDEGVKFCTLHRQGTVQSIKSTLGKHELK
jgi:hypothetical protein